MRVLSRLVPLAPGDRTAPTPTAQPVRISLTTGNERSSRYPRDP